MDIENKEMSNTDEVLSDSDILASIPREGGNPFGEQDEQEKDTPAESPSDEQPTEDDPPQEGEEEESKEESEEESNTLDDNDNVPFHKNPRWQRLQEEKKALEAKVAELSPLAEKISEMEKKVLEKNESVPLEYQNVFGENVEAYNNWVKLQNIQKESLKKELIAEMEQKKIDEQKAIDDQQKAIQANIEYIEDNFNVSLPEDSSKRNDFVKFMWDYQPSSNGKLDFPKGWKLYSSMSKPAPTSDRRKSIASKATASNKGETPKSDTFELGDFIPNHLKNR